MLAGEVQNKLSQNFSNDPPRAGPRRALKSRHLRISHWIQRVHSLALYLIQGGVSPSRLLAEVISAGCEVEDACLMAQWTAAESRNILCVRIRVCSRPALFCQVAKEVHRESFRFGDSERDARICTCRLILLGAWVADAYN